MMNAIRKATLENAEADDDGPKKKVRALNIQADEYTSLSSLAEQLRLSLSLQRAVTMHVRISGKPI